MNPIRIRCESDICFISYSIRIRLYSDTSTAEFVSDPTRIVCADWVQHTSHTFNFFHTACAVTIVQTNYCINRSLSNCLQEHMHFTKQYYEKINMCFNIPNLIFIILKYSTQSFSAILSYYQ